MTGYFQINWVSGCQTRFFYLVVFTSAYRYLKFVLSIPIRAFTSVRASCSLERYTAKGGILLALLKNAFCKIGMLQQTAAKLGSFAIDRIVDLLKTKFNVIIAALRSARSPFCLLPLFFSIPQPPPCFAAQPLVSIFEQSWDV